ncbi:DUF3261 domain-containing protein [Orbaceae bacterium ESL0721]|nr:DUF3261 domain-containing protein [Orbaceae bacterium ESL0721]
MKETTNKKTIKKKLIFSCLGGLLSILITACHSINSDTFNSDTFNNKKRPSAWLTKTVKVNLPDPRFPRPFTANQLLTFYTHDKTDTLFSLIEADQDKLTIIGLSTLGVKLFHITYQKSLIETKQYLPLPQTPPVVQILSDIMLTILPIDEWQKVLPNGWSIVEKGAFRYLQENGKNIIIIKYDKDIDDPLRKPISIEHTVFGYRINIMETAS